MTGRPKDPKTARNKNVLVIGGSGSGKTRFYVKPNLMQCFPTSDYPTSFVVTDPKGTLVLETGQMFQRAGYRVKILNTINFSKSMKYNPFVYIHSEKDVLKLVNTLIANTKGEGEKSAEDFWVKSERLFYTALIGYIWYEAPAEEMNFTTLLEMINASEAREDDPDFQSPVDLMFERLEQKDPDHFAVRQYKKFLLSAGKTRSSILISCGARLAPFDIREVRELMEDDEMELDTIGDEKTVLFLIMSDTDTTFNFILAMLQSQLINLLCDRADDKYGGRLPVHVRLILDEFANIGQIPNFDKLIATMEIIAGFVSSMIMTVVFALMLLSVDWRMALLLFAGIIPGYILYQQFQKGMVQLGEQKKNAQVAMIDSTLEYVQGMETIKAYRLEQSSKLVEKQVDGYCSASDRYEATLTNWSMGYKICLNLGLFLSLGVGIAMVRSGSLAPATYLFFAIMGVIFYRPLEALMGSFAMMNLANASLDNIAEIDNLPTENEKQETTQFADAQADVRFENVSFSYDGKREAVSHVSFSAKPGTITALVGPSGSGKSTLLNLIPGFITPKNGRILLNGKDAATLKHSDLVRHVSVVFQEVYLFQDTMMNNIRMGNQSATDEQVIEAAKKAHCHEFIEKLPQGYQTVISEGGASLSGGERQRIAIARAILKDSPIILLDEALSSLDAENAVAIQKGIEEMIKGKTVFLVSHTLSYIQNADQILVLSDGILQGCGKHEELLQTVPLYQTMWEKEKSIKNWKLA